MVECFEENEKRHCYKVNSADGYCAELEVRKICPNFKIGEVARLENLDKDKKRKEELEKNETVQIKD